MASAARNSGISRQILSIVLLIIVLITAGMSIVNGVTGFKNLTTITLNELERMSRIFSVQIDELQSNAEKSVTELESNLPLAQPLAQITNLGPYYIEGAQVGQGIEEAEKIYTFQSQLEVAQALHSLKNIYKLSAISMYSLSPFGMVEGAEPVLNLRMDSSGVWVAQFKKKGDERERQYYRASGGSFKPPQADLFDVSSVYQLSVNDFYTRTNFEPATTKGFEEYFSFPEHDDVDFESNTHSIITINDGTPVLRTWGYVRVPVSNPETWETESVPVVLLVIEQEIDAEKARLFKSRLGIDVALAKGNQVVVSSLDNDDVLGILSDNRTVESSLQEFYYAARKTDFKSLDGIGYSAVVLSPISTLAELTQGVFVQLGVLAVAATLLAVLAIYWVLRRLVTRPLRRLMTGVEKISQGDLSHEVEVESENELGLLASAFNNMSAELSKKTDELLMNADSLQASNTELQKYQTTLQEMVEQRTERLQEAQKQLIQSEKMASLGELVAGVAHEINTPVGVGVTAASYLADEAKKIDRKYKSDSMTREDFQEFLSSSLQTSAMILSNLQRATELVKSFKNVAVDQTAEDRRHFSVKSYIEEVLVALHPALKKTRHDISVKGSSAVTVDSYPGVYSQIITNLVMNSVIHAFDEGETGKILIELEQEESNIILRYSDNGHGLDQEGLAKIFDPFFTTKRGLGGTGLGMHVVYNLVTQKLQGTIVCESTAGEGIEFTLTIPTDRPSPLFSSETDAHSDD